MTIEFNLNGKNTKAEVLFKGFYNVDKPESYQVQIGYSYIYVPVSEAIVIS